MRREKIWLVGAGPMAVAYAAVLKALGRRFEVIGRSEASANAFEDKTGYRVRAGGLDIALEADTPPTHAVIAPGVEALSGATIALLRAGTGHILVEKPAGLSTGEVMSIRTSAEHLGLPDAEHVREGVVAARIAAHAGDIAKGVAGAREADKRFSLLRRKRDWDGQMEMCLDPKKASDIRSRRRSEDENVCSMCGEYCVFRE